MSRKRGRTVKAHGFMGVITHIHCLANMRKTFKFRLRPTPAQETAMIATLEECRWLYNHLLEERKVAYETTGTSPSLYDQHASLPALRVRIRLART